MLYNVFMVLYKKCIECRASFPKTPNVSMKTWEESRKFCSIKCKATWQSRENVGAVSPAWKEQPSYSAIHHWIKSWFGKPDMCENRENNIFPFSCSTLSKSFQWATKHNSTNLRSRNSYMQLCASCHARYDSRVDFRSMNIRRIII